MTPDTAPAAPSPFPLRVVCGVAMALYALPVMGFLQGLSHDTGPFPRWFSAGGLAVCLLAILCLVGIWRMRRVAVLGYVLVTAAHNALLVAVHAWNIQSALLVPSVVTFFALSTLHRMK